MTWYAAIYWTQVEPGTIMVCCATPWFSFTCAAACEPKVYIADQRGSDLCPRRRTGPEKTLTTSERELRLLVEAIPALVWRARPEGNIEYVNKRVLDYFGAPLSEVIGWGWMDKVHPDDVAFKVRTWLQNLESGNTSRCQCADFEERTVDIGGSKSAVNHREPAMAGC